MFSSNFCSMCYNVFSNSINAQQKFMGHMVIEKNYDGPREGCPKNYCSSALMLLERNGFRKKYFF